MICPNTSAKIYSLSSDLYGKEQATGYGCLPVLIQDSNSWIRSGSVQQLEADSTAIVWANDMHKLSPFGRVEGHLLHVDPYDKINWYRVDKVSVARDLLLKNKVKHYELSLSRSKAPKNVCEEDESNS